MDDFGSRLRTLRKEAGITQTELAEKLNVHLQTVSKWERGLSEPDFSLFGELADILGVSLEKLVGAEEGETVFSGTFDAAAFGKNLAKLRKDKGESQEQLAELLSATASAVSKWERGIVCPDRAQLLLLAEHAGQPVSRLYYGIGEKARTETPAQAVLRKRYTLLWAGLGALVCAALIVFSVFLPQVFPAEKEDLITVTVDGVEMTVDSDIWFGPHHEEREGYEFVGWVDAEGNALSVPMEQVPDGTEFCSVYRPAEYTLDYWLNGGTLPQGAPYTITVESGSVQLPLPQKSGAAFEGWFLTPDYSGEPVTSVTCAAADVSLYARWSETVYTIRYDLADGGVMYKPNTETVTAEEEIALSEPLRAGSNFLGWYDAPAGGERYETVGGADAKNLTLYAHWQECGDLFTILYETDGGVTDGQNPNSVGTGEWVSILFEATKTGYDFVGWNSKADGTGTWYTELYGIRSDLVLYAVYTPEIYTVVYELGGGTYYDGKENPNRITYGEKVPLASVAKAGHTFRGWFDAETGGNEVTQIDESNILRLHTLYARFKENVYICEPIFSAAGGGIQN